jgi:hypothetical protein
MSNGNASELARALQEVTQTAQLLVREEIALARAEVSEKAAKLIRGAVVGAVAGVFLLAFLLFLLHAIAWGIWSLISDSAGSIWAGFAILAGILLFLAVIAGVVAARFVRRGVPPTPQMAIEEAQLIRQTVATAQSERDTVTPMVRTGDELSRAGGEPSGARRAGS